MFKVYFFTPWKDAKALKFDILNLVRLLSSLVESIYPTNQTFKVSRFYHDIYCKKCDSMKADLLKPEWWSKLTSKKSKLS